MVNGRLAGSSRPLALVFLSTFLHGTAVAALDCPGASVDGQVLRVRPDDARGRMWILGTDALYLADSRSPTPLQRFPLQGWMRAIGPFACAPDVAIDDSGAALVSSNVTARLWRVDPVTARVVEFEMRFDPDERRDIGFTSLAVSRQGAIEASAGSDRWQIDLASGTATRLAP